MWVLLKFSTLSTKIFILWCVNNYVIYVFYSRIDDVILYTRHVVHVLL